MVTVFTVSTGKWIHARTLVQEEAERVGTEVYKDTGVVPDIWSTEVKSKDWTQG